MINYPDGRKGQGAVREGNTTEFGRRGMELEKEINRTNAFYLSHDIAVIHKKPTPVTIVKVDYPKRSAAKITEAYFKLPSTTDYNGVYKGRYIDFEAKDNQLKTSFPLKSIHPHQIRHLDAVIRHGAVAFVIVRFVKKNEIFYVPASRIVDFYDNADRSSIPYDWFTANGYLIPTSYLKPVDYLQVVDQILAEQGE
jgi:recombination protein U